MSVVAPAFSRVPPQLVTLQQQLQQRQQEYGSAVLIVMTAGEISAVESFGTPQANALTPTPVSETHYIMASVSKLMTAWGGLALTDRGMATRCDLIRRLATAL